jgi:hypothetical protein
MATDLETPQAPPRDIRGEPTVAELVAGVLNDAQELMKQQLTLFKHEMKQDAERLKEVALSLALGMPLVLIGGLMLVLMLVSVIHEAGGLSWWASFGIIGGSLFVIGVGLALVAWQRLQSFNPVSDQTAEALK